MKDFKLSDIDLEKVTGGVLNDDQLEYLDRVMFYAKQADKKLEQVLADLTAHGCNQEMLEYVKTNWYKK